MVSSSAIISRWRVATRAVVVVAAGLLSLIAQAELQAVVGCLQARVLQRALELLRIAAQEIERCGLLHDQVRGHLALPVHVEADVDAAELRRIEPDLEAAAADLGIGGDLHRERVDRHRDVRLHRHGAQLLDGDVRHVQRRRLRQAEARRLRLLGSRGCGLRVGGCRGGRFVRRSLRRTRFGLGRSVRLILGARVGFDAAIGVGLGLRRRRRLLRRCARVLTCLSRLGFGAGDHLIRLRLVDRLGRIGLCRCGKLGMRLRLDLCFRRRGLDGDRRFNGRFRSFGRADTRLGRRRFSGGVRRYLNVAIRLRAGLGRGGGLIVGGIERDAGQRIGRCLRRTSDDGRGRIRDRDRIARVDHLVRARLGCELDLHRHGGGDDAGDGALPQARCGAGLCVVRCRPARSRPDPCAMSAVTTPVVIDHLAVPLSRQAFRSRRPQWRGVVCRRSLDAWRADSGLVLRLAAERRCCGLACGSALVSRAAVRGRSLRGACSLPSAAAQVAVDQAGKAVCRRASWLPWPDFGRAGWLETCELGFGNDAGHCSPRTLVGSRHFDQQGAGHPRAK